MLIKSIIVVAFLLILISLGTALFHLTKYKDHSQQMAKALSFRIGLSLLLFIFLFIAVATGLIKPHGIGSAIQEQRMQSEIRSN